VKAIPQVFRSVSRRSWLLVLAFACAYGVHTNGEAEFRTISAAPFVVNLPPQDQYLYGSPFTFLLGAYYQHHGLDYAWAFLIVNSIGLAVFFVSLAAVLSRDCPAHGRDLAAVVLFSSPLLFVLLSWVGKSDSYLLAFYFLFLLSESSATRTVLCCLMVICHRELSVALLFVHLCFDRSSWRAAIAGVLVGETAVYAYTHLLLSSIPASRAGFARDHAIELWQLFRAHPLLHIAATFGPFWVFGWNRAFATPVRAFGFAAAFALAAASYDFTRIFVIVATPLLLAIAREVVLEATTGDEPRGRRWLDPQLLWPLMFTQFQYAGARLLFAQGLRLSLR
jgi:hypothetical protein